MTKLKLPQVALVALTAAGLGLAGCDSAREDAAEDTADAVRESAEATADAIENQAEGGVGDEMAPAPGDTATPPAGTAAPTATATATATP